MTKQERDAWAAAYRLYDQFAPGLRQAAALDDDNEMATRLFGAAAETISPIFDKSDDGGRLILLSLYGILESVFTAARNRSEASQAAAQGIGKGNTPPGGKGRQTA